METKTKQMNELEEISKPILSFIKKYYDPHTIVVIRQGSVKVVSEEMGLVNFY